VRQGLDEGWGKPPRFRRGPERSLEQSKTEARIDLAPFLPTHDGWCIDQHDLPNGWIAADVEPCIAACQ
jgi:hypothetical protein